MAISKIKGSAIQDATIPEEKLEDEAGSFRMILDASDGSATDAGDFLLLDATASSTNVGEQFLFEPATDDGSATLSKSNHIISSNLVTDELRGLTSINSISVRGEGFNTTNLQQGLCKVWMDYNGNGTDAGFINDSFGVSTVNDAGVGRYDPSFTNPMVNAKYSITSGAVGGHLLVENAAVSQTGKTFLSLGNTTFGAFVDSIAHMQICGDLS